MARKAIVLAAGYGTRLRPFTSCVPKPLLPVWGESMLSRAVAWLRGRGVEEIVVNCHYLAGQVEEWCAAIGCRAVREESILGTGGVLNPLRDWIGEDDFWLVNGDIVFELEGRAAELEFDGDKSVIGKCFVSEEGPRTVEVEPDRGYATCWHSPDPGWPGTFTYCGIALLKAGILKYVKEEGFSSIIEAYEKAAMDGLFVKTVAPEDLLWTDAGTVASYISLNETAGENAFCEIPQIRAAMEAMGKSGKDCGKLKFEGARGSDRAFFKGNGAYFIIYDGAKRPENAKYANHAKWLAGQGVDVPEVLADLPELGTLVLENAGSEDLLARSKRRGEDRLYDYVAVVEALARFNSLKCPLELEPLFDAALYKWERDLFKEHCLGGRFHMEMPQAVEAELEGAAAKLLAEPLALVHRDFQSTNIIWKNDKFKFIDFQGMRLGPAAYDLASLLYDPYVDLREGERHALAALYAKKSGHAGITQVLPFAAVERLMQALGAYGRLAAAGQKGFTRHIMPALQNLLAAADDAGFDTLGALAEDLIVREGKLSGHGEGCSCGHAHHHEHGHECGCGHHHGGRP